MHRTNGARLPRSGALLLVFAAAALAQARDQADCRKGPVTNPAASCPDQFAWTQFAKLNATTGRDGLTAWERWATDQQTFPEQPQPQLCAAGAAPADSCPTWPDAVNLDVCLDDETPLVRKAGAHGLKSAAGASVAPECVQRNRPAFDYIVANALWYQEGLAQAFARGLDVQFPADVVEIKTNWVLLGKGERAPGHHTRTSARGTYKLVSFHISTKDLPMWLWATFEHVDNPGRCDFLGCHDSFGVEPSDVPPHDVLGERYPPGKPRPELMGWLARLDPVWANYRLKGTQVAFSTNTGAPTLLGNSVTEQGFVQGASCLTCHARAAVDQNGRNLPSPQANSPDVPNFGQNAVGQSYNGTPDPAWFYDGLHEVRRQMLQTDFVWGIPFRAQPIDGAKP